LDNDTISDLKHTISNLDREVAVLEYSSDGALIGVGSVGKYVTAFRTTDYQVIVIFPEKYMSNRQHPPQTSM
jgi:hypothetical protein